VGGCGVSTQLDLFNEPKARIADPPTSRAAAAQVDPSPTETAILEVFRVHGACTDDELCHRLPGLYGPTVKTARSRLSKRGLLVPAGSRLSCRQREMTVWKVSA
jgi:hypothetical protein